MERALIEAAVQRQGLHVAYVNFSHVTVSLSILIDVKVHRFHQPRSLREIPTLQETRQV